MNRECNRSFVALLHSLKHVTIGRGRFYVSALEDVPYFLNYDHRGCYSSPIPGPTNVVFSGGDYFFGGGVS